MREDIYTVFNGLLLLLGVTGVTILALIWAGGATSMTTTLGYISCGLIAALLLTAWWTQRKLDIFSTVVVIATNVLFLVQQYLLGSR